MMKCHLRLKDLYGQLSDENSEEIASKACISLIQEMELFCNFCGQRLGKHDDSLQALRCSHIFHEKYFYYKIFFIFFSKFFFVFFLDVYMNLYLNVKNKYVQNVNKKIQK